MPPTSEHGHVCLSPTHQSHIQLNPSDVVVGGPHYYGLAALVRLWKAISKSGDYNIFRFLKPTSLDPVSCFLVVQRVQYASHYSPRSVRYHKMLYYVPITRRLLTRSVEEPYECLRAQQLFTFTIGRFFTKMFDTKSLWREPYWSLIALQPSGSTFNSSHQARLNSWLVGWWVPNFIIPRVVRPTLTGLFFFIRSRGIWMEKYAHTRIGMLKGKSHFFLFNQILPKVSSDTSRVFKIYDGVLIRQLSGKKANQIQRKACWVLEHAINSLAKSIIVL